MRRKLNFFATLIITTLLASCTFTPESINYRKDNCDFCQMTIMDPTHGALYMTQKGKTHKFDAIECMVNQINQEKNLETLEIIKVSNYLEPETMVNARTAGYLISKQIKSPMGANLSGFSNVEIANAVHTDYGGEVYSWDELLTKFED